MKGNWLSRLWKKWFGVSASGTEIAVPPAAPSTPFSPPIPPIPATPVVKSTDPRAEPAESIASGNGLILRRRSVGNGIWRGSLSWQGAYLADTLEKDSAVGDSGAIPHLPGGNYTLNLDTTSGWNASYGFWLGDLHQGMLAVKPEGSNVTHYLRMGDNAEESLGHILLGTATGTGLNHSDQVYKKVYQALIPALGKGNGIPFQIVEA